MKKIYNDLTSSTVSLSVAFASSQLNSRSSIWRIYKKSSRFCQVQRYTLKAFNACLQYSKRGLRVNVQQMTSSCMEAYFRRAKEQACGKSGVHERKLKGIRKRPLVPQPWNHCLLVTSSFSRHRIFPDWSQPQGNMCYLKIAILLNLALIDPGKSQHHLNQSD